MESMLVDPPTMQHIIDAGDVSGILAILFQTDFKEDISRYGGMEIKKNMIDFALSRNLANHVNKLEAIVPTTQRKLIRAIIGKWDFYNVRLAIEAKDKKEDFDKIEPNIVDGPVYKQATIREAMREGSVEGVMSRLMINSPYSAILKDASAVYSRTKDISETITSLDIGYYGTLSGVIFELTNAHYQSALIIKKEIDMKNILTLIRAKRLGIKFQSIEKYLIGSGNITRKSLEQLFGSYSGIEDMIQHIDAFDLKESLDVYKRTKNLISFEIGMRNHIINYAIKSLKPTILSFGTILAYIYLKEMEIYTIRISVNSKLYGLTSEDISRLMIWKK